jgi:ABC-type multidrug transport system fused ATPase/permease subunit
MPWFIRSRVSQKVRKFIKKYKKFKAFLGPRVFKLFIAAIGVGVLAFGVEASFVLVSQGFLNALGIVAEDQLKLPAWYPRGIVPAVVSLCLFGLARGFVQGLKRFLATYTTQSFAVQQRKQLYSYGLLNADKISTGDIMGVFGDRVRESGQVLQNFSNMATLATSSMLLFAVGLKIAPLELVVGLALLFVFMLPLNRTNKRITSAGKGLVKDWDKTNRRLVSGLKNFVLLKIYKQIDKQVEEGRAALDSYLERHKTHLVIASIKSTLPTTAGTFVIALLTLISHKYSDIQPVMLLAFFYIFVRISQSLGELSFSMTALRFNMPSFKALYDWHLRFLDHDKVQRISQQRERKSITSPVEIVLDNVCFRYSSDTPWVIQNKSMRIAPGSPCVIKGPSGSGKSTLLRLILGLETPEQGQITWSSVPVVNVNEEFWDRVSYVGPEPFLIEGTLRENLTYGHPCSETISDDRIESALRQAQLWGEIISHHSELDRPLSDHAELSTGQRQRLSIARALLRDADIYIWDEATANLDRESEARIIEALKPLFSSRTCLIVTHKDSFDGL